MGYDNLEDMRKYEVREEEYLRSSLSIGFGSADGSEVNVDFGFN
jgi:hypothetical protein